MHRNKTSAAWLCDTVQIRREDARNLMRIHQLAGDTGMSITAQSSHRLIDGARRARDTSDIVCGAPASSSIALNGSVDPDCDALARAAQNVARWKSYLSEECVRAMMSSGWHWST